MGEVAPTMYLGMEGTGVPMRPSEVEGRTGKQPDGSARTREAKVQHFYNNGEPGGARTRTARRATASY